MTSPNSHPSISIVIPCRNEEYFIESCLNSILANDYPKEKMEVLIVDGMSTDGTCQILKKYTGLHPNLIKVLDNPKKEQQLALNIGITRAQGEIIIRMDAHSTYKENYISECILALQKYPADNVGGRWITVPRNQSLIGRTICLATSVSFGVGNAYYRLSRLSTSAPALDQPTWEINVAYFCCRREIFDRFGLFNEKLDRSEDIDFRARLKKAGYRTLFVPTIECYYSMRTKFGEFIGHMFKNGMWVLLPLNHAPNISFSLRHVVPLVFVSSLFVLGGLSFLSVTAVRLLEVILGTYFILCFYYSLRIAIREKKPVYFLVLPFLFLSLHTSYGLGSVVGLLRLVATKMRLPVKGQKCKTSCNQEG